MTKIKVLNIVAAKVWGGGEQYVYDISKDMSSRNIKVYVAVDAGNVLMCQRFAEVAEILPVNFSLFAGFLSLNKIKNFINEEKINIINCHSGHTMFSCVLLKFLTGIKLVMFKHNAQTAKYDFYHKWLRKYTDAFICVSKLVYRLQTRGIEETKEKFHLVYNGINTKAFSKYEGKSFTDERKYIIGYAGRLAHDKGIDILLQAFARIKEEFPMSCLYLAGQNEKGYQERLEKLCLDLNITNKVKFLGRINDMEKFYRSIDLFVLPSVVRESFGLVLCEAIYCGVPVITTDSGAQKEIIKDEKFGFTVSCGNTDELTEALRAELYKGKRKVADGNIYVERNFSIKQCSESLISIYRKLLS